GFCTGSVKWGDYDNDGDLDILTSGFDDWIAPQANIYRNDGNFMFTNIYAGLAPVAMGNAVWADYDNDGDLDAAVTGKLSGCGVFMTEIYENLGNDLFNSISAGLPYANNSFIAWGDYDNDLDLDILVAGDSYSGGPFTKLFRNDMTLPNIIPQPPQNLSVDFTGNTAMFTWEDGSDPQTPATGLSYNLRIGTQPLDCNNLSPMAHMSDGYRKIVALGNTSLTNFWMIRNLVPGTTYYWSVQTIDNSFAASEFSQEQSFTLELTGLNEAVTNSEMMFHPNPAKDFIFISPDEEIGKTIISIYTLNGKMLSQMETLSREKRFSVQDLQSGVYFIEIEQNNNHSINKLIIK
ncbi:MAG: T9SS type A sorting domain-containing protein, partial [Bacteroidales bacterium]